MSSLTGKVAIITGAGSGMGRATALLMARRGAKVTVAARNAKRNAEVVALINDQGGEAIAQRCDVTVEADVAAMVRKTVDAFGRLDILHNNAALLSRTV